MTGSVDTRVADPAATDKAKLAIAGALVIAGVVGYYLLSNQQVWLRWIAVAVGLVLAAVVVATSRYGTELRRFFADSRVELRKIVWPNRQETLRMTLVVFIFLTIAGVFFWGLDLALAWATRALTGQGS